ncbi:MAG: aspartate 1-decarboxylase [Alphaproteobacteria bacterium]|nr:aspartate 1-decarboxylase [Alphaproteobacteria bacterium]
MYLTLLKTKLHGATVTKTDLHYEGSIAIDENLMDAAGLVEFERVDVWNVTCGSRIETYVIKGERGAGEVMLNGGAARHAEPGDKVVIAAFATVEADTARNYKPTVVIMGEGNAVKSIR